MTKLIRPLFYYCRDAKDNDCARTISRMRVIPEELRREVSNKYEKIFLNRDGSRVNSRKDANDYLDRIARKYRPVIEPRTIELKKPPARKVKPNNSGEIRSKCGLWRANI